MGEATGLCAVGAALPARTRRLLILGAWALYDVASSTYVVIVPSLLFAVYFTAVVAVERPDATLIIYGVRLPGPADSS